MINHRKQVRIHGLNLIRRSRAVSVEACAAAMGRSKSTWYRIMDKAGDGDDKSRRQIVGAIMNAYTPPLQNATRTAHRNRERV